MFVPEVPVELGPASSEHTQHPITPLCKNPPTWYFCCCSRLPLHEKGNINHGVHLGFFSEDMVLKNIPLSLVTHYSLGFFTIFAVDFFLWMLKHFFFSADFALCAFSPPHTLCIKTAVN